jgi:ABC-2 type transport system permease protein
MRGLWRKIWLENRWQLAIFSIAMFVIPALLTMLLPQLEEGLNQVFGALPFVRRFVQTLLGEDLGERIGPQSLQAIIWVHPTVLALLWAQEIVFCTRVPPGEIDRGTIDILLSWPVSRRRIFATESLFTIFVGIVLILCMLAGHYLARQFSESDSYPELKSVLLVLVNLYSMYLAVAGATLLIASMSNHRGRAMAASFALVLASFLLNFLVQFWPVMASLGWLSVLHYYRPAEILATGRVAWANLIMLLCIAGITWIVAGEILARRSITTV